MTQNGSDKNQYWVEYEDTNEDTNEDTDEELDPKISEVLDFYRPLCDPDATSENEKHPFNLLDKEYTHSILNRLTIDDIRSGAEGIAKFLQKNLSKREFEALQAECRDMIARGEVELVDT